MVYEIFGRIGYLALCFKTRAVEHGVGHAIVRKALGHHRRHTLPERGLVGENVVDKRALARGTEIITPEVAVTWGAFVQTIVDFLIIAFCIFLAIKFINKLKRGPAAEPEAPAAPAGPTQEELLAEIRDLLRAQADKK